MLVTESLPSLTGVRTRSLDHPFQKEVFAAHSEWLNTTQDPRRDVESLLRTIRERNLDALKNESAELYEYQLESERHFDQRWERAKRYRLNVVFEIVFFSLGIALALWPWWRNARSWQWALHWGSLPVYWFLPYLLGYCPLALTSAGHLGVVLYPHTLSLFYGMNNPFWEIDRWFFSLLPPVLEPLSQQPGPAISISGAYLGPSIPILLGAFLAALTFCGHRGMMKWLCARSRTHSKKEVNPES